MSAPPYRVAQPFGHKGALGLVVLQADETIEGEFRSLIRDPGVALHVTRIPSGADLTPASITRMERDLPAAVRLLPEALPFRAVGYACTSGTTLIGADRVADLVRSARAEATGRITNPLTAANAAFRDLGVRSVGLVSPYVAAVAEPVRAAIEAEGIAVPEAVSFGEISEANVARIDPASIADAARDLARAGGIDAVFLSCTNLQTMGIIPELERDIGLPVLSSNQVLAWHLLGAFDGRVALPDAGRLFARTQP